MATTAAAERQASALGLFERWLSLWVAFAIIAGLLLGNAAPELFRTLASLEYASVNLPVAVLIWAMIYPMMVAVDFSSLRDIGQRPKGLILTVVVNWLVKPFTMAALAVLFFEVVFADLIAPADAQVAYNVVGRAFPVGWFSALPHFQVLEKREGNRFEFSKDVKVSQLPI